MKLRDIVSNLQVHRDEKPHSCHFCGMNFRHKNSLVRHLNRHKGEHPYLCQHCKCKFATVEMLNKHLETEHLNNSAEKTKKQQPLPKTVIEREEKRKPGRPRKHPVKTKTKAPVQQAPQYSITIPQPPAPSAFNTFNPTATPGSTFYVQNYAWDPNTGQQTPILSAIQPQQFLSFVGGGAQGAQQPFILTAPQQQPIINLPLSTETASAPITVNIDDIPVVIQDKQASPKEDVVAIAMQEITGEEGESRFFPSPSSVTPTSDQSNPTSLGEVAILTPPPSAAPTLEDDDLLLKRAEEGIKDAIISGEEETGEQKEEEGFKEVARKDEKKEPSPTPSENLRSYIEKKDESFGSSSSIKPEQKRFECQNCGYGSNYERLFSVHQKRCNNQAT